MPTKKPSMNSRLKFGAHARSTQVRKASQRTDQMKRIMEASYTVARRLSNWKSLASFLFLMMPVMAQAATLLPPGKNCFYDANADPLAGGTVQFYIPSTTTPKDTWQNAGQTVLNTNPVVLDSAGCAVIYGSGIYRQVLKDNLGNLIWDQLTSDTSGLQISWGGVSTGTANAQVLPSSGNFSQQSGQVVGFTAGITNTGATTVSVGGSAIPVVTDTKTGPNSLTAGQITVNNLVAMMYDAVGGKFHLLNVPPQSFTAPTVSVTVQVFTTSGTYTPTTNAVSAKMTCVGGGGGGGGAASTSSSGAAGGGGGGAGGTSIYYTNTPASLAVTIGAGGSGGTAGANAGSAGGDTSVGSVCIGKGGSPGGGGASSTGTTGYPLGGLGGVSGTGTITIVGQGGGPGKGSGATLEAVLGGYGGNSTLGPGGAQCSGGSGGLGAAGVAGQAGGGGGAACSKGNGSSGGAAGAGGAGGTGKVIIEELIFTPGSLG